MPNKNQIDYNIKYDKYWTSDIQYEVSTNDLKKLSKLVVETCGYGKVLDIGCGKGNLVAELLKSGVDAFGVDVSNAALKQANGYLHDRLKHGSVLTLPFDDNYFDTIVSVDTLEHLATEDVAAALNEICRVAKKYAFLRIVNEPNHDWHLTAEDRDWWETKCLEAGFRKHPGYYRVNTYESLNEAPHQIYILLEKIPSVAINKYSMTELNKQRILHMDMLREVGRRGDAHCIRYHKATEFIRPGDTVLDLACGLGYGSHIIYHNSQAKRVIGMDLSESGIDYAQHNYQLEGKVEFSLADAQNIENLPDNSVDFITTFETIEHLPEPKKYLAELERVLKPSGRMLICAPNNWADETGEDPNPHHFHVYTWDRLKEECGTHFILEKGFVQTAGGAMKCHHSPRAWHEVSIDGFDCEAEWIILLCMKDPMKGKSISYLETQWDLPESDDFNIVAFAKEYQNPWILRGVVTRGQRLLDKNLLLEKQRELLLTYPESSVDYAAALCGYLHAVLENELYQNNDIVDELSAKVDMYLSQQLASPHHIRWNVSIAHAAGVLYKNLGNATQAFEYFKYVTQIDVTQFSPLLGNKTLDAYFDMAILHISLDQVDLAKENLLAIVDEVKRISQSDWINVIGNPSEAFPFGFPEMSQLFDKAARAVYVLNKLDSVKNRPEMIATEAKGYYERIIENHQSIISEQNVGLQNLYNELDIANKEKNHYINESQYLSEEVNELYKIRKSILYRGARYFYRKFKVLTK